jgi:hypothetical protein
MSTNGEGVEVGEVISCFSFIGRDFSRMSGVRKDTDLFSQAASIKDILGDSSHSTSPV